MFNCMGETKENNARRSFLIMINKGRRYRIQHSPKLTASHTLIIQSIRDTLVLLNCESVSVSWMLAERDDWVPRNAAPLMWLNREVPPDIPSHELPKDKNIEDKRNKVDSVKEPVSEDSGQIVLSTAIAEVRQTAVSLRRI